MYVLKLEHEKWYVGHSTAPLKRFDAHMGEEGAAWTAVHPPLALVETLPGGTTEEMITTLRYMELYGIDAVRGGPWCTLVLTDADKSAIIRMLRHNEDACFVCGATDHWAATCPARNTLEVEGVQARKRTWRMCYTCGATDHWAPECPHASRGSVRHAHPLIHPSCDACDVSPSPTPSWQPMSRGTPAQSVTGLAIVTGFFIFVLLLCLLIEDTKGPYRAH